MDNSEVSLGLATFDQILEELGKRSAYGNFIFITDDKMLIGKEISFYQLRTIVQGLVVISEMMQTDDY